MERGRFLDSEPVGKTGVNPRLVWAGRSSDGIPKLRRFLSTSKLVHPDLLPTVPEGSTLTMWQPQRSSNAGGQGGSLPDSTCLWHSPRSNCSRPWAVITSRLWEGLVLFSSV